MTQPYFAVWASDAPGMLEARRRVREAHRARLRDPGEHPVRVLPAAPRSMRQRADERHVLVLQAEHIDAVRRFVAEDP